MSITTRAGRSSFQVVKVGLVEAARVTAVSPSLSETLMPDRRAVLPAGPALLGTTRAREAIAASTIPAALPRPARTSAQRAEVRWPCQSLLMVFLMLFLRPFGIHQDGPLQRPRLPRRRHLVELQDHPVREDLGHPRRRLGDVVAALDGLAQPARIAEHRPRDGVARHDPDERQLLEPDLGEEGRPLR